MAKCINITHPDFVSLVNQSNLDALQLSAKMGVWMEKNDTDEWPTLNQLTFDRLIASPKSRQIENIIRSELPIEIANTVEVIDNVPNSVLGNRDIFFAMKDILATNGITDPLLVNWAGINKALFGHPKDLKSTEQLENLLEDTYNKKVNRKYEEFVRNHLASISFEELVIAL